MLSNKRPERQYRTSICSAELQGATHVSGALDALLGTWEGNRKRRDRIESSYVDATKPNQCSRNEGKKPCQQHKKEEVRKGGKGEDAVARIIVAAAIRTEARGATDTTVARRGDPLRVEAAQEALAPANLRSDRKS